jgi:hypothetical protein
MIIRAPCYAKSSRGFVSNRGLADPHPGLYRAPFRKSGESGPVWGPDCVWSGHQKRGSGEVTFSGFLRRKKRFGFFPGNPEIFWNFLKTFFRKNSRIFFKKNDRGKKNKSRSFEKFSEKK